MTAANTKTLAATLDKAVRAEIARSLGPIANDVLRAAIEDTLHAATCDKLTAAMTAVPPKAFDIAKAVGESMAELSQAVKGAPATPLKTGFKAAEKTPARAPRKPVLRVDSDSYGGKGGRGYGGK